MSTTEAKIEELEKEYARTQKNKATEGHLGLVKAKLAKLRRELEEQGRKTSGGGGEGFDVKKVGDTRVGLVGFPSVGKSTLLTTLTGTQSEAAAYEFTTLTAIPGTMKYRGARIQILDLPGIIEGASSGKGRGRQVISAARTCDLIMIILDCARPVTHKFLIERELSNFGIRLNESVPEVTIRRSDKGGISVQELVPQTKGLTKEIVVRICKEYKITSADVVLREDCTIDRFIDSVDGKRTYIPALYVMNKIDQLTIEELDIIDQMPNYVPISSLDGWNIDELMEAIWEKCNMLRVYTKPRGQIPDYDEPVVLHANGPTVEQFCNRIHKAIMPLFKYAWVWGSSVRHQPQRVGKDHVLADEDVLQIVKKVC
ncbi:P-loop containing nucleoside triphosphate hydrolase protein [Pelagophyceae sp. CCMP2097]|nr:P-loop containing nucleoside triphosphate hydrolase protein [Pelagophyceae sp. CCMP2097]|eukprot:CAMPEP_0206817596 /NCGR_PEP_ID=MMETSP0975-20121206/10376_1 /ASSEMBLY_ACC=CAM_ASM_000399 /TAXON_ID=483370 /ORGANISM="non described non described, Strain CCMP2097" /LENGTH=370 /DNA_ID=CAMNT_0054359797 /DNA_START=58 /DNA_END=1170 /DNA_ORIENTATION=+